MEERMWTVHHLGRLLTVLLIIFEILLIRLRFWAGGVEMQTLNHWMWVALLVYLNFQMYETTRRDPTNQLGFFADNSLAFLAVMIAIVLFALYFFDVPLVRGWRAEEIELLIACTLFGLTDFVWGILIGQRIAFAGKERGEYERRAHND